MFPVNPVHITNTISPRVRKVVMYSITVTSIERHNKRTATIHFNIKITSFPGQFVMLYLPGLEEIPLSLSSPSSVTVRVAGETTRALVNTKPGSVVGIRGAFGSSFSITDDALLVGGGIGIAPLKYLHDYLKRCGARVRVIYGERSAEDIIWSDLENVTITTDDGSTGIRGTVLNALKDENLKRYSRIYACGGMDMLKALYQHFKKRGVLHKVEFSLEKYMRCGIGVCGSCVLENGLRVCADGPVFPASVLRW